MNKLELKEFRKHHNLTQNDLADIAGVGIGTVQSWEQGYRNVSQSALKLIEGYKKSNNVVSDPAPEYQNSKQDEIDRLNRLVQSQQDTISKLTELLYERKGVQRDAEVAGVG